MAVLELHHNALSSCSQKVRLALAEKGLEFTSHEVDLLTGEQHAPGYVKLNPKHVVPTLLHDGGVLTESTLINEYLDDAFPEPALLPASPAARHAARRWVKRIDDEVHPAAGVLTYAIGARQVALAQPPEAREAAIAAIPDPDRRAVRRSVIEHGVAAPEFAGALARFVDLLDDMNTALATSPWLTGAAFGLADAAALPYVLRLEHLAMTKAIDDRTRTADWLARVKARPAYAEAVARWLPAAVIELLRQQGEAVWSEVEPLTRH